MDSSASPNENRDNATNTADTQGEFTTPDSRGKRKETHGGSGASSQPPKKILPSRSSVWSHFTRTQENRDKCVCHYYKRDFSCNAKSGTSNLMKHIGLCKQYKSWLDGEATVKPIINGEGRMKVARISESVFREASNEMLVLGELPLAFIEGVAWKHFCNKTNAYKPHSRRTTTRDIVKMYLERKASLKELFKANKQRVSLTIDIWVAPTTGASYMVITMHYIDAFWRLRKLVIGFKYVSDHKGQIIPYVLLECLAEWGIEKILCVTVDNATANSSAIRRFQSSFSLGSPEALVLDGSFMHMRCYGHIINLIVRDGLAELNASVDAIRNAITYVRSSTNRLKSFDLKVDSVKITRSSLPMDIKTRWNSTYLMLTKAIKFRVAFGRMEIEDKLYNDFFLHYENGVKRVGPPQRSDWNVVERLARFLIIFYNSTLIVSSSTSLNSFKCYGEIVTIATNLLDLCNNLDPELKAQVSEMFKKFDKYWDGLKNINKILIIATVFDPRKKMQFAKMCFEDLYGKDSVESKEMFDSVFDFLKSLYNEYSGRYVKGNVQTANSTHSSHSSHSQSQSTQEQPMDRVKLTEDELGYTRIDFRYKELMNEIGIQDTRDELETYLKEGIENPKLIIGVEYDLLSWWKVNSSKFPILSEIARDVLAIQVEILILVQL